MDRKEFNTNDCNNYNINSCNNININNNRNINNNINYGERNNGLQWTNESHSKFLSSMEASFVQNMLERSSNAMVTPKLDRFVPDISESTLDVRSSKGHLSNGVNRSCKKKKKTHMIRRPSCKMVHDQVVPQLEEKADDNVGAFDLNK